MTIRKIIPILIVFVFVYSFQVFANSKIRQYTTIELLITHADFIVEGTVSYRHAPDRLYPKSGNGPGLPITHSEFIISKVLFGENLKVGQAILIMEVGGEHEGLLATVDSLLLPVGKKLLLFLTKFERPDSIEMNSYVVLGADDGVFEIRDGLMRKPSNFPVRSFQKIGKNELKKMIKKRK